LLDAPILFLFSILLFFGVAEFQEEGGKYKGIHLILDLGQWLLFTSVEFTIVLCSYSRPFTAIASSKFSWLTRSVISTK
jgi:hypothetical protein